MTYTTQMLAVLSDRALESLLHDATMQDADTQRKLGEEATRRTVERLTTALRRLLSWDLEHIREPGFGEDFVADVRHGVAVLRELK